MRRLEETESAALGAALQAMWAVDRQLGPSRSIAEVTTPFVRLAEAAFQPGEAVEAYRESAAAYADALARLHGVARMQR